VCRYCGTGCGVMVGVKDGKVVAVKGDELNPVNKGLLCVKGYTLPGILYGKDRLRRPLIRKGGEFVETGWDEALDLIAIRFKEALKDKGPNSIAMYGSGQWTITDGYVATKFMRAGIGSNNLDPNARLCMASAVAGYMSQFGSDEPMGCYDDLDYADTFFIWGANMAECHPVLFSRIQNRVTKGKNIKVIELATQMTRTTSIAHKYLEFKPQTDLAIANAIAHVIIKEGLYDKDFVKENVVFKKGKENPGYGLEDRFKFEDEPAEIRFDEYKKFLDKYTPEYVSKTSGVKEKDIIEASRIFGDPKKKTVSLWTMGVNQHSRGTWMNNLIMNLHLLTGKISTPGNGPFSLTGQPSACGTIREVGCLSNRLPADMVVTNPEHRKIAAKIWNCPVERIPDKPGFHTMEMFKAMDRGELKVLWIQCTNPFQSLPNLSRYRKAAKDGKAFIVVSDVYPNRTTELADVILPSAMWVEKTGMYGNSERRTQHWFKMAEPPGKAKPDWWQIVEVGKRLGLGHLFDYKGDFDKEVFEEYRRFTIGTGKDMASYDEYVNSRGLRWPVNNGKETKWRYNREYDTYVIPHTPPLTSPSSPPSKGGEGEVVKGGKWGIINFYKAKGGKAVVWQRPYEPPAEVTDEEYPFYLSTGRVLEQWHTGTMTGRIPELRKSAPEAVVNMNPADAQDLGIKTGERVRVISRRGEMVFKVDINGRTTPQRGTLFVPFFDENKLVNLLCLDSYCPISKEPDYKKCAVKIRPVNKEVVL
ncbi:MAG: molybdopterin-dependent oxidoreductase, partial [Nitrospinae bacterium]|nr:molybdopterin-dependent oxidoreductase [Nitrospinota bacterium]